MALRTGSPMRQAAQGYTSYALGGVLGSLGGTAVLVTPVILAGVLTSGDQPAIRIPVLLVCSAAYGVALAWAGIQVAAVAAGGRMPELSQVAVRSTA
jgi:ABC-2 type transport system permease protein